MDQDLIAVHKHLTDAKDSLVLAILDFYAIGSDDFDATVKELKEQVGNLCAALKTIESSDTSLAP